MTYQTYLCASSARKTFNKIKTDGSKAGCTVSRSDAIQLGDEHIATVGLDAVRTLPYLREVTFNRAGQLDDIDLLHLLKHGIEHGDGELGELRAKLETPGSLLFLGIEKSKALVITNNAPAIH